jgi:hypothetical protein
MKKNFNLQRIDVIRKYIEKHISLPYRGAEEVVIELCDEAEKLYEENVLLKEQIFQIEQEQNPDKQWETILAAKLDRAIRENSDKDYLEINNSVNGKVYTITIQKKFGKTPEQLQQSSDLRRAKAAQKIVNLLRDNKIMQAKLYQLNEQFSVLKKIKYHEWDDIKTREDIQVAIDMVNLLIKQHNNFFYKREMAKLTNSMRESFHESWSRVSQYQWEASNLQKEIVALKQELNRKNIEKSKFKKYGRNKKK